MRHLIKPNRQQMTLVHIPSEDFPRKLGKFPDYIVRGLDKPSFGIGSRIKSAYKLGKILYKTGAGKKAIRYRILTNKKKLAFVSGGIILGTTLLSRYPRNMRGKRIQQFKKANKFKQKQYSKDFNRCCCRNH